MGQQLAGSGLEGLNVDAIAAGIATALVGEQPAIEIDEINNALQELHTRVEAARQEAAKVAAADGEAFLKDNALRSEVTVLESGLQYEIITEGTGEIPTSDKQVRVHYHGELTDGTVFDSSVSRGQPAEFPVTGVIKGWVEALQLMPVGSKWKLYIPQDLAYGERGAGAAIPPFAALVFEVELLDIL
jgi:FKBP-type peptidyl-prolyl cis-trans isomerase FklB